MKISEIKKNDNESLNDLSKEVLKNPELPKPIELPKDDIEDAQKDYNSNIAFKSSVTSICVCARCIRCPSK